MSTVARRASRATRTTGLLSLLVCLLLVGVIRSAIPERPVGEYWVLPDDGATVRTDDVSIELVSLATAGSIRPAGEFSDERFEAAPGAVLLLGTFTVTAHGDLYRLHTQFRTADGYSYEALPLRDFPQPAFHVGFTVTTTFIYEVPADKLDGVIGIHGLRDDGLQPVAPLIAYALPEDLALETGEVLVPEAETEPRR